MDLNTLWLQALQEVVGRASHEVKDALNGVSLNLEVIRSRTQRDDVPGRNLATFATAASDQLELLTARTESMLFLARPHYSGSADLPATGGSGATRPARPAAPADVAATLKHLAALLVPAARSDGVPLDVGGHLGTAPTSAPAQAVRLALAAGLLDLIRHSSGGRCRLNGGRETVVRFSHESARAGHLEPAIAKALAEHHIRIEQSASDLAIVFPEP